MYPMLLTRVNDFLKKHQVCIWYQDDTPLAYHRLFETLKPGTTRKNKLKHPKNIKDKQWKILEKEGINKGINTSDAKEVVTLVQ